MKALIEKLETARGPQFALDCEIAEALLPDEWFGSKVEGWFGHGSGVYGCNTVDGKRHLDCLRAPNYTASLGTAKGLIPARHTFVVGDLSDENTPWACVTDNETSVDSNCMEAATPELALCIAALKARSSIG